MRKCDENNHWHKGQNDYLKRPQRMLHMTTFMAIGCCMKDD